MVRFRLYFKGLVNFKFPKDYDDGLTNEFYSKIQEFQCQSKFKDFNLFTFSDFEIEHGQFYNDCVISLEGIVSVVISSVDEYFLRELVSFFMGNLLSFEDNELFLFKFYSLKSCDFDLCRSKFISVSPIYLKDSANRNNLFSYLEDKLVQDYCEYYNVDYDWLNCEMGTVGDVFRHFVDDLSGDFYMMDLFIQADSELISFAYDKGLGDDTHKGFGMLDLY